MISIGFRRPAFVCVFAFAFVAALVTSVDFAVAQGSPAVKTLTLKLQVVGPRPAISTGFSVTTTCRSDVSDLVGVSATQGFSVFGGAAFQYFSLGQTSACVVSVVPTDISWSSASVYIAIGGTVRASGTLGSGFAMSTSQYTSVTQSNTIDVVVTYPAFTVRMATVGTETVPGVQYLLAVVCTQSNGVPYARTTFKLRAGASRMFSVEDIPELVGGSSCRVAELEVNGSTAQTLVAEPIEPGSVPINGEVLGDGLTPGANPFVDANFIPPIRPLFASGKFNPNGTTVTVTNRFVGDLMVSKVVAGSPSSNIAIYELQLSCNDGTVKDSFLLKHGQTWLRTGLLLGWSCVVAETRSDGAEVSFADNSGANATDGKVTIKATPSGCTDSNLSNFPDCRANIVVTNSYSVPSQSPTVSPTVPLVPVVGSTTPVISVTSAPVAAAPVDEPEMLDPSEETVA